MGTQAWPVRDAGWEVPLLHGDGAGRWPLQVTLLAGCQAHFWNLELMTGTNNVFHCILQKSAESEESQMRSKQLAPANGIGPNESECFIGSNGGVEEEG